SAPRTVTGAPSRFARLPVLAARAGHRWPASPGAGGRSRACPGEVPRCSMGAAHREKDSKQVDDGHYRRPSAHHQLCFAIATLSLPRLLLPLGVPPLPPCTSDVL